MNLFNRKTTKYPITAAQNQERAAQGVKMLAYIIVAVLVLVTGAHAVMLVLSEAASFTLAGQSGLMLMIFTALRVGFPLIVELAAVISVVGSIRGMWRGDQKTWATAIDGVWLVFAAANMITFFAIERGQELQGWQVNWLQYGLPLSGIIAGIMVTKLLLADPDHQREEEESAAAEGRAANEFNARIEVESSEPMKLIQRRRAWRDYINGLAAKGYSPDEIAFIIGYIPELQDMPRIAAPTEPAATPSLIDKARAAIGIGQNTQSDTPTVTPLAYPVAGQGEKPNGPPPPRYGGDSRP